jgi:hypothetical protein
MPLRNREQMMDIKTQLQEILLKMNTTTLIVFILLYIVIVISIFSVFVIIELLIHRLENEIEYTNRRNKYLKRKEQKEQLKKMN